MDAAKLSFQRISLSIAFALLMPAAATAYTAPAFSISPSSVTLTGQAPGNVQVTATSGQIGYEATVSYPTNDLNWLCVTNNGGIPTTPVLNGTSVTGLTTPNTLTFTICGSPAINVTTHTATVTLTATDQSGAVASSFGVSATLGSGGGGGTGSVIATPSTVNATVSFGGSTSALVYLTTSSTTPIGFTLAGPSVGWASWVQSSGNTGFVSAAQEAILTVSLNGAGQSQASLTTTLTVDAATGNVNIPVTLNNGVSGSGGTSGTGTITVSPSTLQWSYSQSNPGAVPTPTTVTVYSTSGSVNYTATAQSQNGWLEVNSGYTTGGIVGQTPLVIAGNTQLDALAPGTYTGTVTVTETDDNATATITVTATVTGTGSNSITINPSPIPLSASLNGTTVQTTVTISSAVGGVLTATVAGSGSCSSCLSVSGTGQTVVAGASTNITVFGNPAGLTNGTYVGTLNVSVGGNSVGAQINFVVGTGSSTGGGTNAAASPSQLNFYYETNTSMQASQTQQVYLSGSGSFTVSSSTTNSSPNWLSVSTTSNALPTTIYVTANASGLSSSTYTGQITITNTSTAQTTVVNVSLLVEGVTTIFAYPNPYEDVLFTYIANVSTIQQVQAIEIASSDGTSVPVTAAVANATTTPWLTVSGSGNTPIGITVTANASNLANGVYSGSITVTGGFNSLNIPVVLTVTGSSVSTGTGTLTLGASALTLQGQINGSAVSTTLSVSASTATNVAVSSTVTTTSNGITWLSVSPFGTTTTPATVTVTGSPAGLAAGTYSGTVNLVANGSTQTVPVTFVVGSGTGGSASIVVTANGNTTNTSPSLTFTATSLNQTLSTQTLAIASGAGSSGVLVTVAATTTSGGSWIQLNTTAQQQYQTPLTLTVTPNTAGLAGGTYNGTITITPVGGTAVTVPVSLTIAGAPAIAVSTSSLTFAYTVGGTTPGTQTVPVTVSNATSGSFTATEVSTPSGWLAVSPASGTAPGSLTVSVTPTGLAAGTYTGTITVAGTSPSTGSATITVSLTVTAAALPTITTVVNGASFLNQPLSPGEIITIGGSNLGPTTAATFTLTSIGGISTVPSTAGLAGVTVTVNGYYAPILYVSATQINAVVPYEVAGILRPSVQVTYLGQTSNGFSASGAATAPGIFTANGSGTGPGAILNADNTLNSASNAAARGTVVQVFLTGEGQTNPAGVDGKVTQAPYPSPLLPIAITVAGVAANFEFAGEAPGLVSGVLQLNVIIPPVSSLATTGTVPLVVSIGSVSSQSGITVSIK